NINGHTSYHDGKYYETCAECLLSEDTTLLPDGETKGRYLFLFSTPTRTMAAQLLAVALVALITTSSASSSSSSNSTSTPQSDSCDDLVKPLLLDSHSPIYGKWVLHVGSWDEPGLKNDLATVKASWVDLSASTDNGVMTIYWADRLNDDKCLQGVANATITGMTSHTTFNINGHTSYHDGKYYETCAECLLSEDTTLLPDGETKGRYLFLFTRTGSLEPSELEKFKKQAECLKFLPEFYYGGTELCEDNRESAKPTTEEDTEDSPETTTAAKEEEEKTAVTEAK
ncbi:hypothetical protein CRUP_029942, partial [Coryphaenoides rupestris]